MLLDKQLMRVVLGVAVFANAINLGVLTSGRFSGTEAAFVLDGAPVDPANPLPQALAGGTPVATVKIASLEEKSTGPQQTTRIKPHLEANRWRPNQTISTPTKELL